MTDRRNRRTRHKRHKARRLERKREAVRRYLEARDRFRMRMAFEAALMWAN